MSSANFTLLDADEELGQADNRLEFKSYIGQTSSSVPNEFDGQNRGDGRQDNRSAGGLNSTAFNVEYYQYLFDIELNELLQRCWKAVVPIASQPTGNFVQDVCDGRPDLYGPFWSLTTLAFTLYVFSSLSSSISAYLTDPEIPAAQDIGKISLAAGLVYSYGIGFPAVMWAVVRWFGKGEVEWSLVEAWLVWGYSMTVFIPISFLCIIPVPILRWILVLVGAGTSGWFLLRNVYPVLSALDSKLPRLLVILILVLHGAIALTFKLVFFSYSVGGVQIGREPLAGLNPTD
ncbi:Uncharacterized conserved protein [Phaffia rhodozyma]|uniref:Protein YIP n=1 Tax=Phaffia rhodozyma TaxID=264483 RepID=A0A0F7SNC9_PHARH|nr:Uncharacterized conserved protein [Phaffia rhodozyma]